MGLLRDYFGIIQVEVADFIGAIWLFIIHNIVWRFSGINGKLRDIKDGKEKVYTAQVLRNCYTLPGNVLVSPISFIFTHDHFAPAKTFLRDNVFFLGFENEFAKFIELDAKADMFNLRKNPILFIYQVPYIRKIISIPRKDVMEVLDNAYVEGTRVVWCFHTIRCGSTVWSQMFAALPNWVTYSESQTMFYSIVKAGKCPDIATFAKTEEYEKMVVASIKLQILMAPRGHSIFWKTTATDEHMIPVIKKHFPSHDLLLAYRDCLSCASSFYKAFGHLPMSLNNMLHANREVMSGRENLTLAGCTHWSIYTNGYNAEFCRKLVKDHKLRPNAFEWFVMCWAAKVSMMREYRKNGIHFKALKYEELRRDPIGMITELFEHLNISLDLVDGAHKTMELDSQAGTFFSHEKRVDSDSWLRTPDSDRRCNGILKAFGLPDLGSQFNMPEETF